MTTHDILKIYSAEESINILGKVIPLDSFEKASLDNLYKRKADSKLHGITVHSVSFRLIPIKGVNDSVDFWKLRQDSNDETQFRDESLNIAKPLRRKRIDLGQYSNGNLQEAIDTMLKLAYEYLQKGYSSEAYSELTPGVAKTVKPTGIRVFTLTPDKSTSFIDIPL